MEEIKNQTYEKKRNKNLDKKYKTNRIAFPRECHANINLPCVIRPYQENQE
jgi:hypothetical protein